MHHLLTIVIRSSRDERQQLDTKQKKATIGTLQQHSSKTNIPNQVRQLSKK